MIRRANITKALNWVAFMILSVAQTPAAEPDAQTGPASVTGTAVCERATSIVISLAGPAGLVGAPLQLLQGDQSIATCTLERQGDSAATTITLPMPGLGCKMGRLTISATGKIIGGIDMPDTDLARLEALYEMPFRFEPAVFSSSKFPTCDFEQPARAKELVGRYAIESRFFDKDYNQVTTASADGRYGAVVEIRGEGGLTCRRFLMLCRVSRPIDWRELDLQLGPRSAKALGISPAMLDTSHGEIEDVMKQELRRNFLNSPRAAALMAWLIESKKSSNSVSSTGPGGAEEKWWFGLKKKLGLVEHRYLTFLPRDYEREPAREFPLILFLHGSGERGLDVNRVRTHGPHKFLGKHPELPFIVIEPQCLPGEWWNPEEVLDLLDVICSKYRVDPKRIYLTGLSMGGYGTWSTIPEAAGRFAAAVPICGGGNPKDAAKLKDTPLWVFHGTKDPVVPVERSREMVRAVRRAGGKAKLTEYPETGHESWTQAYNDPALYEWLLKHHLP